MRKHYIITIAAIVATGSAYAQQRADSTMQQTLTLEREFSPIVQKTNKIDQQPAPQPVQTAHSQATYAEWDADAVRSSEIDVIPAGQIVATKTADGLGYLQVSGGNYVNSDVKAGAHKGDFSIDADGLYSKSDLELMTGNVKAAYSHTLANEAEISADIHAGGLISELDLPDALKHKGGIVGAGVGFETDRFHTRLGYDYQGVGNLSENTVSAIARYGLYDNSPLWQLSFDLPLAFTSADHSSYFTVKPSLHFTFLPYDGQWKRYDLTLASGTSRQGAYQVLRQLPLATFAETYGSAFDVIDATVSFQNNEQGYLRWGVMAQARLTNDALSAQACPDYRTYVPNQGTIVDFRADDNFYLAGEAHVDYEFNRFFGIKAKARYQYHSCRGAAFGQPVMIGSLHFVSAPGKVNIDLGFDAGIDRKIPYNNILNINGTYDPGYKYDLGDVYDLNFRIDWQINRHFRTFAFGRNLLNSSTELLPLVKAQGINIHGGLRWDF